MIYTDPSTRESAIDCSYASGEGATSVRCLFRRSLLSMVK